MINQSFKSNTQLTQNIKMFYLSFNIKVQSTSSLFIYIKNLSSILFYACSRKCMRMTMFIV